MVAALRRMPRKMRYAHSSALSTLPGRLARTFFMSKFTNDDSTKMGVSTAAGQTTLTATPWRAASMRAE